MERIAEYALIGDRKTAALVSRRGSVDWLCIPNFDSPACFAALIGQPENGYWLIGPTDPDVTSTRRYLDGSMILETTHQTPDGVVRVTDSMPSGDERCDVVRRIEGLSGAVNLRHELVIRFGYGKVAPWIHRQPDFSDYGSEDMLVAVAGPDLIVLRGPRIPKADGGRHVDDLLVAEGDVLTFELTTKRSYESLPEPIDIRSRVHRTRTEAAQWLAHCEYAGPYKDAVDRSLVTLRALTDIDTGGIVAAPTCSLPEEIGGERNWDYRFCWLRDASLTLEALLMAGYQGAAMAWRNWLVRSVAGDPADLQIMYTIDGSRQMPERELEHLAGYESSRPVRVGNGAVNQKQTDVLGEVMISLAMVRDHGLAETDESWAVQRALVNELCENWQQPDNGVWEIRGPQQHFTHSRVMVWVALDRAIGAVEKHGLAGEVERWREVRADVREEILTQGFNAERGSFTQHYQTTEVDAALLLLADVGFIDAHDERFVGTVRTIEQDLTRHGLLLRYRTQTGVDGIAGDEAPFLACSFWLVSAYALMGRLDDAHELMCRLVGLTNDVGLLSEEYDPVAGRMLGNFPQAFSHLALVVAAYDIESAESATPLTRRG
jgi:GH15 family glucan-1,4-alpha-glucosidase